MYKFSKKSKKLILECDKRIQDVLNEAIKYIDFSVIKGHRCRIEQNIAYNSGYSNLLYPHSKHNKDPSLAVDIQPYPFPRTNVRNEFTYLAGHIMAIAKSKGINLKWGGDWNRNNLVSDNNFNDLYHFEVVT